jgi:ribosome-binding protein aMBF1 (putative translation factor)
MIKTERQYQITKAQAEKFEVALKQADARTYPDPLLAQLERDALRSQFEELRDELSEYDQLRSGSVREIVVDAVDQLPHALIKARIASGLSQKDLADRLGLKEQQIQRYEATDYSTAGLGRIGEVVKALGSAIQMKVTVPSATPSPSAFFKRLKQAGVSKDLITQRLISPLVAANLEVDDEQTAQNALLQTSAVVSRVYGWSVDDLFSRNTLSMPPEASCLARFKMPARANESLLVGYVVYAHHLSRIALKATPQLKPVAVPTDATEFRRVVLEKYKELSFETVLRFAWDMGVVVLPLRDSGAFHGATWREAGRNVVVLKQRTSSLSRWLNDLIHELFHAGQEPEKPEREVIEADETSSERRESPEEQNATRFSGDVILGGRAEALTNDCVQAAGGRVERLKTVVPRIASLEGVPTDALANYLAFRLSLQGINWWGAATNLQPKDKDPWLLVRDWLLPKLSLSELDQTERDLITQALTT